MFNYLYTQKKEKYTHKNILINTQSHTQNTCTQIHRERVIDVRDEHTCVWILKCNNLSACAFLFLLISGKKCINNTIIQHSFNLNVFRLEHSFFCRFPLFLRNRSSWDVLFIWIFFYFICILESWFGFLALHCLWWTR